MCSQFVVKGELGVGGRLVNFGLELGLAVDHFKIRLDEFGQIGRLNACLANPFTHRLFVKKLRTAQPPNDRFTQREDKQPTYQKRQNKPAETLQKLSRRSRHGWIPNDEDASPFLLNDHTASEGALRPGSISHRERATR